MKRIGFLLIALFLLFTWSVCATSGNTVQVLEITNSDGTITVTATQPVTFWESPALRAGETIINDGTLTVRNLTNTSLALSLRSVTFPYGDLDALEYLNHLHLTVKQEETVVFDGPYSTINNHTSWPTISLSPNEEIEYTLFLNCDYTYRGTAFVNGTVLEWNFKTTSTSTTPSTEQQPPAFRDPLLWQWLTAGIVTAVLFAVILFIQKKKK